MTHDEFIKAVHGADPLPKNVRAFSDDADGWSTLYTWAGAVAIAGRSSVEFVWSSAVRTLYAREVPR